LKTISHSKFKILHPRPAGSSSLQKTSFYQPMKAAEKDAASSPPPLRLCAFARALFLFSSHQKSKIINR